MKKQLQHFGDRYSKKKVLDAKNILTFAVKRASKPVADLLESAIANAKNNFSLEKETLFIKNITVDEGVVLKRRMPRARGMAYPIKKRNSHIFIELDTVENMPKTKSQIKKEAYVKKVSDKKTNNPSSKAKLTTGLKK